MRISPLFRVLCVLGVFTQLFGCGPAPVPVAQQPPTAEAPAFPPAVEEAAEETDKPLLVGADPLTRITQSAVDAAGREIGWSFRDDQGNPWGQPHVSATTGVVRTLTAADVTYNVNSYEVAFRNTKRIQKILDEAPDSGIVLVIPGKLCFMGLRFPSRTIGGIVNQPIPCEIRGQGPGVELVNLNDGPAITIENGPSGEVFPALKQVRQRLVNLTIISRGVGVDVRGVGLYFSAHDVVVRSQGAASWRFKECYGLYLGYVGSLSSRGHGFLFEDCILVNCVHLWTRSCGGVGLSIVGSTDHDCAAFTGVYDCEGNDGYQASLYRTKNCRLFGYMEYPLRLKLVECRNIEFAGEGIRCDEADAESRLFNRQWFRTKVSPVALAAAPYSIYASSPFTILGPRAWHLECEGGPGWVSVTPDLPAAQLKGDGVRIRFRVSNSTPGIGSNGRVGTLKMSAAGEVPRELSYDVERDGVFSIEGYLGETNENRLYWFADAGSKVAFELLDVERIEEAD